MNEGTALDQILVQKITYPSKVYRQNTPLPKPRQALLVEQSDQYSFFFSDYKIYKTE